MYSSHRPKFGDTIWFNSSSTDPLTHPLTNFKIQKYYQSEPKFKGVYSQNNLSKTIKDEAYIVNFDEYKSIATHWIVFYVNGNTVTYFDRFEVEHMPEEIRVSSNNNIIINIFNNVWMLLQ